MKITRVNKREKEQMFEDIRSDVTDNVQKYAKSNPAYKVARHVDQPALEKCVLHQYGKFKRNFAKMEIGDKYVGQSGRFVPKGQRNVKLDRLPIKVCDIPLNLSIEEQFFNRYGKGFEGTALPTMMHQVYTCPRCGQKIWMDPATMPMECPRCKAPTPIGQLVKDKAQKRW